MKGYMKRRISGEEKEISVSLRNPTHTNASVAAAASFQNKTVFKGKRIVTTMESQKGLEKPLCAKHESSDKVDERRIRETVIN